MLKKVLLVVLGLIIIGGIAWYADKNYFSKNSSNTQKNETSSNFKPIQADKDTQEKIIYLINKDGTKEIDSVNYKGEDANKIFSDENEDLKIKKIGGYGYLTKEILLIIGGDNNYENKLAIIKSDGSKEVIVDSFGNPNSINISPDSKMIGYVFFSNVEADYGYGLYTMSRDGSNKRQIVKKNNVIKSVVFNKDASKIAYLSVGQDNKSEIHSINTDSTNDQTIFTSDDIISSVSWSESNNLIVASYQKGKNSGEIQIISNQGKLQAKVLSTKEGVPVYATISSDDQTVGFLEVKLKDGSFDDSAEGQVLTVKSSGQDLNKIADGFSVIGWQP